MLFGREEFKNQELTSQCNASSSQLRDKSVYDGVHIRICMCIIYRHKLFERFVILVQKLLVCAYVCSMNIKHLNHN